MVKASLRRSKSRRKKTRRKVIFAWQYAAMACLLLPLLGAVLPAAVTVLQGFAGNVKILWPLLAGAGVYAALQVFLWKPIGLYVFGHELTHALAALVSGFRVKSFTASPHGGHVILSDTNVGVALAPYCFPIYTLIVVAVLLIVQHYKPFAVSPPMFAFAVGFTFAFHAALTLHAVTQRQPDLHYVGPFLSLVIILLINSVMLIFLLKALFPGWVSVQFFLAKTLQNLLAMATWARQTVGLA